MEGNGKGGGIHVRVGKRFKIEIKKIRKQILINTDVDDISLEEVTNLLTRHKDWAKTAKDVGNITEEEINKYGR